MVSDDWAGGRVGDDAGSGSALAASLQRTQRHLERLLDDVERTMDEGPPGASAVKAHTDSVSAIVRVIEKIQALKKVLASEAEAQGTAGPTPAEREALSRRVERWIDERSEERAAAVLAKHPCECSGAAPGGTRPLVVDGERRDDNGRGNHGSGAIVPGGGGAANDICDLGDSPVPATECTGPG